MNKAQIEQNSFLDKSISFHFQKQRMLRTMVSEAVHNMLQEMGGKIEIKWDDDSDYPVICYDGGNHVEYASTMASSVKCIRATLENDVKAFAVDCEDAVDYDENRMLFSDVIQVYDYVCMKYEDWNNENEPKN